MRIEDLEKIEEIEKITNGELTQEFDHVYIGDLLSIVMGKAKENDLWFTVQTHLNVLAVANLAEMSGIVFVEGQIAEEATINKANELNIPCFQTKLSSFDLTKRLIELGL